MAVNPQQAECPEALWTYGISSIPLVWQHTLVPDGVKRIMETPKK